MEREGVSADHEVAYACMFEDSEKIQEIVVQPGFLPESSVAIVPNRRTRAGARCRG
jgi:hypothetical protein